MSNSTEFKPGERVRITIEGPVTQEALGSLYIDAGDDVQVEIPMEAPGITIERVAPAEWPPCPGDLWQEVDGALWFAQSLGGSQMAFIPARVRGALDSSLPAYVLETFGPLTLVHREDEQDGSACKCGFRAPELGPHPDCPTHTQDGSAS